MNKFIIIEVYTFIYLIIYNTNINVKKNPFYHVILHVSTLLIYNI